MRQKFLWTSYVTETTSLQPSKCLVPGMGHTPALTQLCHVPWGLSTCGWAVEVVCVWGGGAGGRGKSPSPFLPGWQVSYSLPWHLLGGWTFQRFRQQGSLSLASPPSGWMPLTSLGHWMSLPQHWLPPWSPPSSYCPLCPLPVPSILILSPPSSACPLHPLHVLSSL